MNLQGTVFSFVTSRYLYQEANLQAIKTICHSETQEEVYHSEEAQIVVVHSGQLRVQNSSSTIDVVAGQGIFLAQGEYYLEYLAINSKFKASVIEFKHDLLSQFLLKHSELLMALPKAHSHVNGLFMFGMNTLIEHVLTGIQNLEKQPLPEAIMSLKYEEMLILLLHGERGDELHALLHSLTDRAADRLHRFMDLHYLKEWKLTDYAQEFGASLTTFKELFNEHYGISPRAWISERRLLHAHKLLLTSKMSIVDIAMETGFSSQSYFTQSYRRRFGTTPSRVRSHDDKLIAEH
ncbi:AraC family transcriptional regulator [Vibrio azureus]|uniref:Putative AraC family transcriptional regulator n=1 Tax=Vibrio azureus NBRC 104587 TaxID=1219077 RepID=U3BYE4_9VIBR|nr:helix-turn-helix domain-containing protein [Vibrio azureus]AUI86001.1 AraC family transcriptional regulator [Vibrio azureus]GAD74309.1 putative AraC family transcriptional regulator [Vibrio azureus NBRC 104587]